MKTNHVNFADSSGNVYCFKYDKVMEFDQWYYNEYCTRCRYFAGSAQGNGIECKYFDGTHRGEEEYPYAIDAEVQIRGLMAELRGKHCAT